MKRSLLCPAVLSSCFLVAPAFAQQQPKVDFAADVQPILQQNCVTCHGPKKQNGGMRVDRRSSVMKALSRRVVPGSSANSMLYHRVSDALFGAPMPPTGELKPEQVAVLKAWIDQGAEWPDALANEIDLPPANPQAVALIALLHEGKLPEFEKTAAATPALLNARGPDGSTPFMFAVLYADAAAIERLIRLGADVNAHNDANATPLMWGVRDLAKTRILLAHGAQVNVLSASFRTPLMAASREPGRAAIVQLLLDHGANTMPNQHPDTASSPLLEAATAGDGATFALLSQHGAKLKDDAEETLVMGISTKCAQCVALTLPQIDDKNVFTAALADTAYLNDVSAMKMLLAHGADPNRADALGRTPLMYAAESDHMSLDAVKLLVAHGADVNAQSARPNGGDTGLRPLDMARRHGTTEIVSYLLTSNATEATVQPAVLHPRATNDLFRAIQDSLPALQRADENFMKNSGCVSCHNNNLTAMTVSMARARGVAVNEALAKQQVKGNADYLSKTAENMAQNYLLGTEDNFSDAVFAYILMGLSAEGYKADTNTDQVAMYLLARQRPDGSWPEPDSDTRQPLCLEHIGQTAKAMHALQMYAPKLNAAAYRAAIARAAAWIAAEKPTSNEDRGWKAMGLAWAGTNKAALAQATRALLAIQKPDGGWSDMPSMDSTAYATGKALVTLHTAGLPVTSAEYKRGVAWLLKHQEEDGSWYVQTRAMAFQPWFDAGFPHGHDQWISSAATNWADMALALALPEEKHTPANAVAAKASSTSGRAGLR